ncbi:PncA [Erwinia typographi]|uniref:Nicotinamidase n=1 Tax=Erwinia typographi TaxID=371042 RepID=A0A0A3Z9D4_9GAMM|nr:bifunctional nicotinamidase/pyrazinamidase [Erwinia typographi]KGT95692.1 PncA [Erwinia typographi]
MTTRQALLLIDLQNDFCRGGALAVSEGDDTIAVANHYAAEFSRRQQPVVATLDWHPASHGSFASNAAQQPWSLGELAGLPQVWWPAHCVQHTHGAELHPALDQRFLTDRVCKGEDPLVDSYSGFYDNGHRKKTNLDTLLKSYGITALTIMGLATDYCVKFSVLDALSLGYTVTVISAGCRGVNLTAGDAERALTEMAAKGAVIL